MSNLLSHLKREQEEENRLDALYSKKSRIEYKLHTAPTENDIQFQEQSGALTNEQAEHNRNLLNKLNAELNQTEAEIEIRESNIEILENSRPSLGAFHFILTYIIIPLMIIGSFLDIFNYISNGLSFYGVHLYYFYIVFTAFLICAEIALIKKSTDCILFIKGYSLFYAATGILLSVLRCIAGEKSGAVLVLSIILYIGFALLVYSPLAKYYEKRSRALRDHTKLMNAFLVLVPNQILAYLSAIGLYGYSVYCMFMTSIGFGLFGVFVPGISQIVYLVVTGFDTMYAVFCYSTVILFIVNILTTYLIKDYEL